MEKQSPVLFKYGRVGQEGEKLVLTVTMTESEKEKLIQQLTEIDGPVRIAVGAKDVEYKGKSFKSFYGFINKDEPKPQGVVNKPSSFKKTVFVPKKRI